MTEINIVDKAGYLARNYPFQPIPKLTELKRCIHCDSVFTVKDYKVFKDTDGEEYIYCPNAPECDGTIIDWFPVHD